MILRISPQNSNQGSIAAQIAIVQTGREYETQRKDLTIMRLGVGYRF